MKNIREAVRDIIAERILPGIERDGVSKLILPKQITPADCARPIRCKRLCNIRHREDEFAIGLTGRAPCCIDNKTFIFTPGRIVLLPGGTAHSPAQKTWWRTMNVDLDRPSSILWLMVYPFGVRVQVAHIVGDADVEEGSRPYLLLGRHFSILMAWLLEEVRSRPPRYDRVGRHILMEFLERCLRATTAAAVDALALPTRRPHAGRRAAAETKNIPDRVLTALEFIHSNYHVAINLDDIAEAAASSADHLGRQFKTATGLTTFQYLQNVRIAAAKELLLTDLKVSEVAHVVGFEDHCYFSRLFRRLTGAGPLQYRQKAAKSAK